MINETVTVEMTDENIRKRLVRYGFADEVRRADDIGSVLAVLRDFMGLSEDDRGLFIEGISALVCGKCGKASCLCGYPDL